MTSFLRSLPNALTYLRLGVVPAVAASIYVGGSGKDAFVDVLWLGFALYALAGITDLMDGYVARRWGGQSALGEMLDPIADKILVAASLMSLTAINVIDGLHLFPALVILCREVLVSGMREFLGGIRIAVPVSRLAKWKTLIQIFAVGFLVAGEAGEKVYSLCIETGLAGLWIAALVTLYTGLKYLRGGLAHVNDDAT